MASVEEVKTFTANGAIGGKLRVKITAASATVPPQVELAGAGEQHIGVTEVAAADGEMIAVRLRNADGTHEVTAAGAFAVGAVLYGAASGKVDDASSGTAIGIAVEAATADGDIVEVVDMTVISTTAATVSVADSGGFTAQTTVEAALAEIFQSMFSVQAFMPVSLNSLREAANFNVGAITANGGILASDTTPALSAINGATDGCQRVLWVASNSDQIIFQVPLPPDFDVAADLVLHIRAAMGGTTNTPAIAVDSFFDEGDTKVVDATGAITGTAYAEYTATINNADFPAAQSLTVGLTPGAHTTDTLAISAVWLEYKKKLLTA